MTRRAAVSVALLTAALLLSGCSSDEEPSGSDPSSGAAAEPSAAPDAATAAEELTEQLLRGDDAPEPLATVSGSFPPVFGGPSEPVTVDVLEVRAAKGSTLLRWRLRSPDAQRVRVYTSALSLPNRFDTRAVALVDAGGEQQLQAFTYVPEGSDLPLSCVCSVLPDDVGEVGALMYGLYPPLDPGTTEVDVLVPGLAPALGVPVTR